MNIMLEWIGFVAVALSVVGYLPQIVHLIKERCSAGLSVGAYCTWGIASVMLLLYAISRQDLVFMILQTYNLGATGLIFFFCLRYKGNFCETHGGKAKVPRQD